MPIVCSEAALQYSMGLTPTPAHAATEPQIQWLTTDMSSASVTIVGAGPSGLTLAWWLIQRGHTITVLERESIVPKDMRASTFHPATLDLLADSGLADELVARGTIVPQWQYLIHESAERAVFDMACLSDVTAYPFRRRFRRQLWTFGGSTVQNLR